MQQGARSYGAIAKQIVSPRELEASLLLNAAARMQAVQNAWETGRADLSAALLYNRKLWTIFLTSVTGESHALPREIRQNVASLGVFVMKQTLALMSDPRPEQLGSLININRQLAAGLAGRA